MTFEKLTEKMRKAAEDLVTVVRELNEIPIIGSGAHAGRMVPSMMQDEWLEKIRGAKEILTGSNVLRLLDELRKRPVDQCMIYIVFSTKLGKPHLERYAGPKEAVRGINQLEAQGFETLWAIQGRRRSMESILEEGT